MIEPSGDRYWCKISRCKSGTRALLGQQRCKGSAVAKWQDKAKVRPSTYPTQRNRRPVIATITKGEAAKPHSIVVSGNIFWCIVCGAFAESAPKLLARSCKTRHQGKWKAGGMPGQLKVLLSGRHPRTLKPIPKPVPLSRWREKDMERDHLSQAIEVWRGRGSEDWPVQKKPRLVDDGTALTRAFLRKGVVPIVPNKPSLLQRVRARQAAAVNEAAEPASKRHNTQDEQAHKPSAAQAVIPLGSPAAPIGVPTPEPAPARRIRTKQAAKLTVVKDLPAKSGSSTTNDTTRRHRTNGDNDDNDNDHLSPPNRRADGRTTRTQRPRQRHLSHADLRELSHADHRKHQQRYISHADHHDADSDPHDFRSDADHGQPFTPGDSATEAEAGHHHQAVATISGQKKQHR